ncbi:unnamed protein product [Phytophthora lilii]|uniref:Unnamed protein product n=1 Tax=Phytophthora lilii TaxID=2077276 RepID=A0A9W7CL19_9STRA|nr:unnamed protein product [Phytophthora lilii]
MLSFSDIQHNTQPALALRILLTSLSSQQAVTSNPMLRVNTCDDKQVFFTPVESEDNHLRGTCAEVDGKLSEFKKLIQFVRNSHLWTRPWLGWAFVYGFVLLFFFVYRQLSLNALIAMYASSKEATLGVITGALGVGFVEDFVCATYFAGVLWMYDALKREVSNRCGSSNGHTAARVVGNVSSFMISWLLYMAMMAPFVADSLLARSRGMRFTFDLITTAIDEKDNISAVPISDEEITEGFLNALALVATATLFASLRTFVSVTNMTLWNPAQIVSCGFAYNLIELARSNDIETKTAEGIDANKRDLTLIADRTVSSGMNRVRVTKALASPRYMVLRVDEDDGLQVARDDTLSIAPLGQEINSVVKWRQCVGVLAGLGLISLLALALSHAVSPLIAYSALNTSLNELLGHGLEPTIGNLTFSLPWPDKFIHKATEEYILFESDTLYRQTTGFHGDVAFDIMIDPSDPPNVLVVVVESFRFHDSRYLVKEKDPSNLFKGTNITITPSFDKWARRGVALSNFWSSWRTSRSVESILFAQIPYDSATKSGMTGGRNDTALSGLPQLFSAKGYETFFTTGCRTDYDSWDLFLPNHGFDTVWSRNEFMKLAETDLGIDPGDWYGTEHRGLNWGVHDDLSFQILGDLMINKTKEQRERVVNKQTKKPLFLTHYTISSHVDYKQRPRWYNDAVKPDFSALYKGEKYADNIKNYLEMRYFTDMELGKFMTRMADQGILNDTIIVIAGDHGQGPEFGNDVPEDRDVSATRVAGSIIAEGRLGKYAGLIIDDATEHYDILNTLADITGVPEQGFVQDGVGRSLKRKTTFGERIVYSNNPTRKMSVVRGHQRLRFDRVTNSVLLHNADTDHDMTVDLFPSLTVKERAEWYRYRDNGRQLNAYYTKRWENACLLTPDCPGTG